ncbi:hypothetical protein SAMN05216474_0319 [Lishizhenia tianjinensis]|uniref:DUF3078 domain-containing protein n=2 Tax=Lishizhenia tianjinensis TaxID=477690 RepID=A0A1I6XMZ7_9FLAO|nr:hypothetical protein SAMN05216474_0319 [Lishizhenia tianjinensis]
MGLLGLGMFTSALAQKSVGLSWGTGHLQRQDLSFSSMKHSTISPLNLTGTFNYQNSFQEHLIQIGFATYSPSLVEPFTFYTEGGDSSTSYRHNFKQLNLGYTFLYTIYENGNLKVKAGLNQENRLIASEYYYAISSSFSYYFSFGVNAAVKAEYAWKEENKFTLMGRASLFAFNARSPYLGIDDHYLEDNYSHKSFNAFLNYISNARFQSLGKYQYLDILMVYDRTLNDKWSFNASYQLGLNFNQSPTHFASVLNVLYLGMNYTL